MAKPPSSRGSGSGEYESVTAGILEDYLDDRGNDSTSSNTLIDSDNEETEEIPIGFGDAAEAQISRSRAQSAATQRRQFIRSVERAAARKREAAEFSKMLDEFPQPPTRTLKHRQDTLAALEARAPGVSGAETAESLRPLNESHAPPGPSPTRPLPPASARRYERSVKAVKERALPAIAEEPPLPKVDENQRAVHLVAATAALRRAAPLAAPEKAAPVVDAVPDQAAGTAERPMRAILTRALTRQGVDPSDPQSVQALIDKRAEERAALTRPEKPARQGLEDRLRKRGSAPAALDLNAAPDQVAGTAERPMRAILARALTRQGVDPSDPKSVQALAAQRDRERAPFTRAEKPPLRGLEGRQDRGRDGR